MTTFKTAATPESRIADFFDVSIDRLAYQKVGRAYVVNTDNGRYIFDWKGNHVSSEFVPNENSKIINPDTFDWDTLD